MSRARPLARVLAVTRKELLDTFRDRRTILVTLLSAAVAGPIFIVLIFNRLAGPAGPASFPWLPAPTAMAGPAAGPATAGDADALVPG